LRASTLVAASVTARSSHGALRHWILSFGFYVAATVVMTSPFVNWAALGSAAYPGDARLMIWTLAWNNHAVLNGLPLFDANVFYPSPHSLSYNDPLIGIALFTLPIYAFTNNAILSYDFAFLLAFVLNGIAMHALAFRYTRQHIPSAVAGSMFAFAPYMMAHAPGHLSLIWTWPLPLSFLLHDRWVDRPSVGRALSWGAVLVLQMLASWYLAAIAIVATGVLFVWRQVTDRRPGSLTRLLQAALLAAVAAAVIWPFAAPYRTTISAASLAEMRQHSASLASYVVPPQDVALGLWWRQYIGPGPRRVGAELTLFLGYTALALSAIGLVTAIVQRRSRPALVYGGIGLLGVALSLGPSTPTSWFRPFDYLTGLPGLSGFRVPARFGVLTVLGAALLASLGAAAILERVKHRTAAVVALALLPLFVAEHFVAAFPWGRPVVADTPAIYRHPAIRSARAIASLPDYRQSDDPLSGSDYFLYSTTHWRRIVNGFGRAEPAEFGRVSSHLKAFPGPNNAKTMRELGVDYIVVHAARYPDRAAEILREAMVRPEYELVAQDGHDYLFRVKMPPPE
jgi:hypothetical protein